MVAVTFSENCFDAPRRGYESQPSTTPPWTLMAHDLTRPFHRDSDDFCRRIQVCCAVLTSGPEDMTARTVATAATFPAVYDALWGVVRGIAGLSCGPEDAQDVAQEVFLRIWCDPDRFDGGRGSMRAYLATMTRGAAIDRLRSDGARRARESRQDVPTEASEPSGDRLDGEMVAERVRQALAQLTPGESDAITAAFFGENTYRDVAILLEIPEGTVKSRIRSGLKKLQVELKDLRA